ncbi:hypothetical protein [Klebsiella michiganensis]|uniref:hypothetical protein n=1 Tax=Klebsiella michiganensis TaxID=1134687 RepID=UPI0012B7006A|nr:hypothetical protein [Klebsiella michiganensis]
MIEPKKEYFNELKKVASSAGLNLADYRLVEDDNVNSPFFVDYPAMWFYYCIAGMTAKEALITEYPSLNNLL